MSEGKETMVFEAAHLNAAYADLSPVERLERLFMDFSREEILLTSSFGTSAAFLLRLVNQVAPGHPVYFIDTGYHFPETLEYKQRLTERLGLHVIDLHPALHLHARSEREAWYKAYPDRCCYVNKVLPLEAVQPGHRVWISGLMGFQNDYRSQLHIFEGRGGFMKFHPLIDISKESYEIWSEVLQLDPHPLEGRGYGSVGCTHCTERGMARSGRWAQTGKTECGLHL